MRERLTDDSARRGGTFVLMRSEPAIVVESRKELNYLLCQAAELEHGLMCQYLYAAFSLKSEPGPGLSPDPPIRVVGSLLWR